MTKEGRSWAEKYETAMSQDQRETKKRNKDEAALDVFIEASAASPGLEKAMSGG